MLRRWSRHDKNLSDEGKRTDKSILGFQVGNEKGSMDLIDFQVGSGDIQNYQVGKGEEMSFIESSHQ